MLIVYNCAPTVNVRIGRRWDKLFVKYWNPIISIKSTKKNLKYLHVTCTLNMIVITYLFVVDESFFKVSLTVSTVAHSFQIV